MEVGVAFRVYRMVGGYSTMGFLHGKDGGVAIIITQCYKGHQYLLASLAWQMITSPIDFLQKDADFAGLYARLMNGFLMSYWQCLLVLCFYM
jgi:hypothetical protein